MTHIAFIGAYGVGKTTAANALVTQHGFLRLPFADAVKQDCADMLDFMLERYYENGGTPNPAFINKDTIEQFKKTTFGPLLQWYGTDFWREFMQEPEHWINEWHRGFQAFAAVGRSVVVDDCRFVNEADMLREQGFYLVRLVRHVTAGDDARRMTHASETEQAWIDVDETWTLPTVERVEVITGHVLDMYDKLTRPRSRYVNSIQTEAVKVI